MYSMENYFWGGVGYVLGVALMLPLLWRWTRWLHWQPLIAFVRILVLTMLLVPVRAYPDKAFLAPAWAVAVFEHIQPTGIEGAVRGMLPIAAYFLGAYGIYLLAWLWWRQRHPATPVQLAVAAPKNSPERPPMVSSPTGSRRRAETSHPAPSFNGKSAAPGRQQDWGNRRD